MPKDQLDHLRKQIDSINRRLLTLLNQRGECVQKIYKVKSKQHIDLHEPKREDAQLEYLLSLNRGPYSNQHVTLIFSEIFRASLQLMEHLRQEDHPALQLGRGNATSPTRNRLCS